MTKPMGKAKPKLVKGDIKMPVEDEALPKYAGNINLERQNIPSDLKRIEMKAAKETPLKKQTWVETDRLSSKMMEDPKQVDTIIEKAQKGGGLNAVEADVMRKSGAEGVFKFKNDMAQAATQEERDALFNKYQKEVFEPLSIGTGESGRALNIYKKGISITRAGKAMSKLGRGLNQREAKELRLLDLDDPTQMDNFAKRLGDPKLKDYFYEYWYNQILSGPPTHAVNAASNTAWLALQVPHRALSAVIDKGMTSFTGKARTRYLNEVIPMMAGYGKGAKRGAKGAATMLKGGGITGAETKWAKEMGSVVGAFDRSPNKGVRAIGKALTLPTRALRAMDVWGNSIGYDGHIGSLARRISNKKGIKGKQRQISERKFAENPPEWAHKEAMKQAKYSTFMDDPGKISRTIIEARDNVPMGRMVVPFVNTIGNLLKRGAEMTPGLGLAMTKGRNPADVAAKQIEGSVIAFLTLMKAHKGEITGAAPDRPNEREAFYRQGKQPWSIKLGDNWVQYRRVEPLNTPIAIAATAHDKIMNAPDEQTATETFYKVATAFKDNLLDASYLSGMSVLFDRHGSKAKGMVQRTATSLVPYSGFWRSINRAWEAQTKGQAKRRDTSEWMGALSETVPGFWDKVPVKLNVWGEEKVIEGGPARQLIPWRWSKAKDSQLENTLQKLNVYPGFPKKTFEYKGKTMKMDEDIYSGYLVEAGSKMKERLVKKVGMKLFKTNMKNGTRYEQLESSIDSLIRATRTPYRNRAIRKQLKRNKEQ
jgi:hypothetical protein